MMGGGGGGGPSPPTTDITDTSLCVRSVDAAHGGRPRLTYDTVGFWIVWSAARRSALA